MIFYPHNLYLVLPITSTSYYLFLIYLCYGILAAYYISTSYLFTLYLYLKLYLSRIISTFILYLPFIIYTLYFLLTSQYPYIILSILKGSQAFQYCSSLTQMVLTDGLLVLGANMFDMGTGFTLLSSITVPSTVTSFGRD